MNRRHHGHTADPSRESAEQRRTHEMGMKDVKALFPDNAELLKATETLVAERPWTASAKLRWSR